MCCGLAGTLNSRRSSRSLPSRHYKHRTPDGGLTADSHVQPPGPQLKFGVNENKHPRGGLSNPKSQAPSNSGQSCYTPAYRQAGSTTSIPSASRLAGTGQARASPLQALPECSSSSHC